MTPPERGEYGSGLSPEAAEFVRAFFDRWSLEDIRQYVDALRPQRVVVVGDAIIDDYVYVDPIGKSSKDPTLVVRRLSDEAFAGGALAVANHVAAFVDQVEIITCLGAEQRQEAFVRERLRANVTLVPITKAGAPTTLKRRFVDEYSGTKLFEVYEMVDDPLSAAEDEELCTEIRTRARGADLVIVADFGHGLIGPAAVRAMVEESRYLAVNTQANAANAGYHTISKYPSADFVSLQERELRLDSRDRRGNLDDLVRALAARISSSTLVVTQGKNGVLMYRPAEGFSHCPAFAFNVVDRVGAGDAVFSRDAARRAGARRR